MVCIHQNFSSTKTQQEIDPLFCLKNDNHLAAQVCTTLLEVPRLFSLFVDLQHDQTDPHYHKEVYARIEYLVLAKVLKHSRSK